MINRSEDKPWWASWWVGAPAIAAVFAVMLWQMMQPLELKEPPKPPPRAVFADDVEAIAWCILAQRGFTTADPEQGDRMLEEFRARRKRP